MFKNYGKGTILRIKLTGILNLVWIMNRRRWDAPPSHSAPETVSELTGLIVYQKALNKATNLAYKKPMELSHLRSREYGALPTRCSQLRCTNTHIPHSLTDFRAKEGLLLVYRGLKTLKITDRINSRLTSPMRVILWGNQKNSVKRNRQAKCTGNLNLY